MLSLKSRLKPLAAIPLSALASALALLAACGDKTAEPSGKPPAEGKVAGGDVREGTISDGMLPLDSVQSQSPRAEIDPSADGSEITGGTAGAMGASGAGLGDGGPATASELDAENPGPPSSGGSSSGAEEDAGGSE